MGIKLVTLLLISELFSLYLIFRLWAKKDYLLLKVLAGLILLIPFLGPLMYFFIMHERTPVASGLKNTGPRGEYTHGWISTRSILAGALKEKEKAELDSVENEERKKGTGKKGA